MTLKNVNTKMSEDDLDKIDFIRDRASTKSISETVRLSIRLMAALLDEEMTVKEAFRSAAQVMLEINEENAERMPMMMALKPPQKLKEVHEKNDI